MTVMPGLMPGIHGFLDFIQSDVDGRERRQVYVVCATQTTMPGHDGVVGGLGVQMSILGGPLSMLEMTKRSNPQPRIPMPIVNRVADLQPDIQAWRRDIHQHPELLYDVHRTARS